MPASITSRLIACLPESLWTEAIRRLRLVPELWALADDRVVLDAFLEAAQAGDASIWRPGPLAMVAYAVQHPQILAGDQPPEMGAKASSVESASKHRQSVGLDRIRKVEAWLLGEVRELRATRVSAAYARLSSTNAPLHPLDDALPAALALRLRVTATTDWAALAADACTQPDRWRLTLEYLWGLLTEGTELLFAALLNHSPAGATLAARCLMVNAAPAEAIEFISHAPTRLEPPAHHWLALVQTIEAMGEARGARSIARYVVQAGGETQSRDGVSNQYDLGSPVDLGRARLVAFTGDYHLAQPVLSQLWTQVRQLRAAIAGQMGWLALESEEPVVARAGFQDALSERPDDAELKAGLAEALVRLACPAEVVEMFPSDPGQVAHPRLQIAAVRAQLALGLTAEAKETVKRLTASLATTPSLKPTPSGDTCEALSPVYKAEVLAEAAQILFELDDRAGAVRAMKCAAEAACTDPEKYLNAARWLQDLGSPAEAAEMAVEAVALAPQSAEVRETYGRVLLECGRPAEALQHFQSAAVYDPQRTSAALGLARAALAAGHAPTALEAAQRALAASSAPGAGGGSEVLQRDVEGEAHTLMGQALSALGNDDQAFEHFRTASVLSPTVPEPWRAMSRHYLERGDHTQALAALEAGRQELALVSSPHTAPLLADLAEVYVTLNRLPEAVAALRAACAADPQAHREHRRLGALLRSQGNNAEAVDVLRRGLEVRPGDSATLHELGLALEATGKVDEAWSALQQATLSRPAEAQPYLDLGRISLIQRRKGVSGSSPLQAIAALRAAIERLPEADSGGTDTSQKAEAYGLLAEAQHLASDPQAALESYRQALQLAPMRTDWSLGLGLACLDLQPPDPQAAIAVLEAAVEHAPPTQTAALQFALARAYAQSELWPEARWSAETALRFDPDNGAILQLVAEIYTHLGQPDLALEAWRQAVSLSNGDPHVQLRLARYLVNRGQTDEARQVYTQALTLAPQSAEVRLEAGSAFLELGDIEQAYPILSQAIELAPQMPAAQAAFARAAMRAQKFEPAHAAFMRAAELEAGQPRLGYLREAGEALWRMNRLASAVAVWRRALAVDPHDPSVASCLAAALMQQGQHAEALETLERSLQVNPHQAAGSREAARAAMALGAYDKASHYLERVVELDPEDAEACFMLGQVRDRQGQPDKALALYQQAAALVPAEGVYRAAAAEMLLHLGKLEGALEVIEDAVKTSPDRAEVQQRAGEIYLAAKRLPEAVRAFQVSAAARPGDPTPHLSLAGALVLLAEEDEMSARAGLKRKGHPDRGTDCLEDPSCLTQMLMNALQHAAAVAADPQTVRFWLGRAKAALGDPRDAQRLLESVAFSLPEAASKISRADLYRALGSALRKTGLLERAREALQASLQHEGDAAPAYLEMGLTVWAQGDKPAAVQAFKRSAAASGEWAIAHYHLAEALLAVGERSEAAQVMQRALSLRPDAAAWHHRLARMCHALNDSAAAAAHFQRAAELEPANADYAADVAWALAVDGDLFGAAQYFRRATDARPQDDRLWTQRGKAHLTLGELQSASECFARALQLAPANVAALLGGARVSLALGDLHDAGNRAEAAARLAPDDPEALICLADIECARGDMAAAEDHYGTAAANAPNSTDALLALGRLYASQQKWKRAMEALTQAMAVSPESDEILAALGDVHYAAGDLSQAIEAYRQAARIAPRQPRHLLRLGRACRAQGQLDQALSHLLQAREIAPHDDEVLREVGLVFERRRQFDRALEMYQLAIRAVPKSSANYTRAGVALKHLKAYAEAAAALERAVALDPQNLEATKQLAVVSAMNLVHGEQRVRV